MEELFLVFGLRLVVLLHSEFLAFVVAVVELLNGLVEGLLFVEADEPEAFTVVLAVLGYLAAEHVADFAEERVEAFTRNVLGQVLDDHVELADEFGVLDLPHQSKFTPVEVALVLALQSLVGFVHVVEVHLTKAQTFACAKVTADFDAAYLLLALKKVNEFFFGDTLV